MPLVACKSQTSPNHHSVLENRSAKRVRPTTRHSSSGTGAEPHHRAPLASGTHSTSRRCKSLSREIDTSTSYSNLKERIVALALLLSMLLSREQNLELTGIEPVTSSLQS